MTHKGLKMFNTMKHILTHTAEDLLAKIIK